MVPLYHGARALMSFLKGGTDKVRGHGVQPKEKRKRQKCGNPIVIWNGITDMFAPSPYRVTCRARGARRAKRPGPPPSEPRVVRDVGRPGFIRGRFPSVDPAAAAAAPKLPPPRREGEWVHERAFRPFRPHAERTS